MSNHITRIAIVGTRIVTCEIEARAAARELLDLHGSSEGERDALEWQALPETDGDGEETGTWEIVERYGVHSGQSSPEDAARHTGLSEAAAHAEAEARNLRAEADIIAAAQWITLPRPVYSVWFAGCGEGSYPQSRTAAVSARHYDAQGEPHDVEVTGHGRSPHVRQIHSPEALRDAVSRLVTALA